MVQMMKAAVLEERGEHGLHVRDVPVPARKPGEVLMRIRAAALNRVDLYMRDVGIGITHDLPIVQGVEAAGEIVEADPQSPLKPGMKAMLYTAGFCGKCRYCLEGEQPLCTSMRITGEHVDGTFRHYISRPEQYVLPLTDGADFAEASTLMSAYLTAWRMLFGKRQLRPGETVLIVGIGSGVSIACLQLAQIAGARAIVTSSSDEKLARAAKLGAIAGINYRTQHISKAVLELTGGQGVDMVIDSAGEASWPESLRSLRRGGRLVTCGATTGSNPSVEIQRMFIRQLEVYGSTGGNLREARELLNLYATGRLKPVIDRRFPLSRIREAMSVLARGEQFGKIVIEMNA